MERNDVLAGLEIALSSTLGIAEAAYFGSTARAQVDNLSDIDLVVRCDDDAPFRFVRRLHELMPVTLYRQFSNDRRPAGRYWFRAANPFCRLDVSFYGKAAFNRLLAQGIGPKQPPFARISLEMRRDLIEPSESLPTWTEADHEFARALRRFHESSKALARGREPKQPLGDAERAVLAFRTRGLSPGVWDLYEMSLMHLRNSA